MAGSSARAMAMAMMMVVFALATAGSARADGDGVEVSSKARLDAKALEEKRERGYVTGLPLINYDSNTGVGAGARVYYLWNGEREDPRFEYTPYLHRVYVQAFATTGGAQYHTIDYDAPYIFASSFRVRVAAIFERNTSATYFGRGATTLDALSLPSAVPGAPPARFTSFSDFEDAASRLSPDGTTLARYDRYELTRPALRASLERDLFGGAVRVLAGGSVAYASVHDYTGENVSAGGGATAPEGATKLHDDCAAGAIVGCAGGWDNLLKVGVAFDTRDFEPDPTSGVFAEVTGEASSRAIGSAWAYERVTGSVRVFVPLVRRPTRIVVAMRGVYSVQAGDVPFFEMNTLAFTDGDVQGLGGLRTVRGFAQDRFVGKVAALGDLELRWTFADGRVGTERLAGMLVPFVDAGRVFDDVRDTSFARWQRGEGGAVRVAWNQATILSVDYGRCDEGSGIYVNFGHQF